MNVWSVSKLASYLMSAIRCANEFFDLDLWSMKIVLACENYSTERCL